MEMRPNSGRNIKIHDPSGGAAAVDNMMIQFYRTEL
jgi:hypothetical protein